MSAVWGEARISVAAVRGPPFAHAAFSPGFQGSHTMVSTSGFFHHRFHRFAFIGAPTPMPRTTAVGGQGVDVIWTCSGSMSAATTAIDDASGMHRG